MLRLLRHLGDNIRRLRWEYAAAEVARQISWHQGYSYTTDWVTPHTDNWARILGPYAGRPGVRMLEIGSWEGRSAVWFLQNILTHSSSELTCVDTFMGPHWNLRFDHNIRLSGHAQRVKKLEGFSNDVLPRLPRAHYDMVYVDGWHDANTVLMDSLLSWTLVKRGGILLFDDYLLDVDTTKPSQRPQMAIDLFLEFTAGRYELLHHGYQVAVRKREAGL